jgi:hypothetical protein
MNDDQLTITDLANIKGIIETACSRGAFQATEMSAVGTQYDRLVRFLNNIAEQAQQAQPQGDSHD